MRQVSGTEPRTLHGTASGQIGPIVWPDGTSPASDADPTRTGAAAETEWLKVEEVASILRLPLSTTYELVRTGQIPSVKLGKHRRIRRDVLGRLGR